MTGYIPSESCRILRPPSWMIVTANQRVWDRSTPTFVSTVASPYVRLVSGSAFSEPKLTTDDSQIQATFIRSPVDFRTHAAKSLRLQTAIGPGSRAGHPVGWWCDGSVTPGSSEGRLRSRIVGRMMTPIRDGGEVQSACFSRGILNAALGPEWQRPSWPESRCWSIAAPASSRANGCRKNSPVMRSFSKPRMRMRGRHSRRIWARTNRNGVGEHKPKRASHILWRRLR